MDPINILSKQKVEEIVSKRYIKASGSDPLSKLMGVMNSREIYEIPVVEKEILKGVVSYDTLFKRRTLPPTTKAEHVMVVPARLKPSDSVLHAAELILSSGMRSLPVSSNKRIVGMVNRRKIITLAFTRTALSKLTLSDIMSREPHCVKEKDTLIKARDLMRGLEERTVPVVDGRGKLSGVIGLKDMIRYFAPQSKDSVRTQGRRKGEKSPVEIEVKSVMTSPPIHLSPEHTTGDAIKLMNKHKITSVVITEKEKPIGIVTFQDLMEHIATLKQKDTAYVQITGLEEDPEVYDVMYDIIHKYLRKINNFARPQALTIHTVINHPEGAAADYTLRLRLTTETKVHYMTNEGWDLYRALDEGMEHLERTLRREKEIRTEMKKKRSKHS